MTDKLRKHRAFAIILSLYAALALLYGVTIPIFETPDASSHYAYIHELTEGRGLPVLGGASGERVTAYAAGRPPLYYAFSAALTFWVPDDKNFNAWAWENPRPALGVDAEANRNALVHTPAERFPWRGTVLTAHIARLVSTALGTLAVVATYGIAQELFPKRRWVALGAASLTAFNPMFVFVSSRVGDDAAVAAFGSLAVWGAVRLAVRGLSRKNLALTGAALGLAVLSKLSALVLVPVIGFVLLRRSGRKLSRLAASGLLVLATVALVCGWWFVRNYWLYNDPLAFRPALDQIESGKHPEMLKLVLPSLKSYWAMFGWFNMPVASWMYRFWQALVVLAGTGLVLAWQRVKQRGMPVLVAAGASTYGGALLWGYFTGGVQGRWLMVSAAPISILLMVGLVQLLQRLLCPFSRRRASGLAMFLSGSHIVLALICLFTFIRPAYAAPDAVRKDQLPKDMVPFNLVFDGTPVELVGGVIRSDAAHPGDSVPVDIYWRASAPPEKDKDLMAFVQILGRDMEVIAGVDCYPGRGNFPPTLWEPGVIYRDRYHLRIAEDAWAPTIAALQAGLYIRGEGRLPMRRGPDRPALDMVLLNLMALRPKEPLSDEVEYPVGARLGDAITLVGYDLSSTNHQSPITVTLVWNTEAPLETNYTVFVHLLDEDDALVAQSDELPLDGDYRTTFWAPGDVVRDPHRLTLDESVEPEGSYTLLVGMCNSQTGERLTAYDDQGERYPHNITPIGSVELE